MEISCAFRSNFRPEPRNFAVLQIIGNLNFRSEFLEFSFRTNYRLFSAKFIEIRRISFALLLHSTVEVTLLHLCDPRVSVCHGCSQPIRGAGGCIPPPADLVVVTKMRRDYLAAGERRQGKLGNVYFHANISCIRSKQAHFLPSLLYVRAHVRQLLTPLHKQHLIDSLGFSA